MTKSRKLKERTCKFCKRVFDQPKARASHERDVHKKEVARIPRAASTTAMNGGTGL